MRLAIAEGSLVYVMMKFPMGGCVGSFLGRDGENAYIDIPVLFSHGETSYDFEVPMKALLELPISKEASIIHGD